MGNITYFVIFALLLATSIEAYVQKPGTPATLQVEQIDTPDGQSYLTQYTFDIIFPGTKWCGVGDIADEYDDLGYFKETDSCCRAHDYCDDLIPAGESKYGLHNDGRFTRLHCKCDLKFFDCLSASDYKSAGVVATAYFNLVGAQCYEFKPPATCVKRHTILGLRERCVKYEYDESKPEEWQWFDLPRYILSPNDSKTSNFSNSDDEVIPSS